MATNNSINNTLPFTGILTGNGTSAITASTVTQYGTVIAGASNAVSSVAPSATSGVPYISQGAASNPVFGAAVVAGGGTGLTATTVGGILLGTSTTAFTNLTIGSNNTVLVSNGTTASWAAVPATAGVTSAVSTANQVSVSAATGAVTFSIPSTFIAPGTIASTTSLTAGSGFTVTAGATTINSGTSAINIGTDAAAKTITIGTTTTTTAVNINTGTGDWTLASATGTLIKANDSGEIVTPLQPTFQAYVATTITNVTGDGTVYTVIFDTETFDLGGDFNLGTGTFTAPVTGKYFFQYTVLIVGGTAITAVASRIVTTARTYILNGSNQVGSTTTSSGDMAVIADMTAADTATFAVTTTDGSGKVDDVSGTTSGNLRTWVSGRLES